MHKPIRMLHCADLHLGSEFAMLPANLARQRKRELLQNFQDIIECCEFEKIDLLLIAGDLFEGSNVDRQTLQTVKACLGTLRQTLVAIAPGNHDYMAIDSPYADEDWPEHVHIFRGAFETRIFPEVGLSLSGAAFTSTYCHDVMLPQAESSPVEQQDLIHIGVIHGDLIGDGGNSQYHPISEAAIAASGLDYLAIGHRHQRTALLSAGQTQYAYSGCPEGRGFDETGEKGVYIGTVDRYQTNLMFKPLSKRMYLIESVDISGLETETAISNKILKHLDEKLGAQMKRHLYKITLTGGLPAGFVLDIIALEEQLSQAVFYLKLVDQTYVQTDYEALAALDTLKGFFTAHLLKAIQKEHVNKSGFNAIEKDVGTPSEAADEKAPAAILEEALKIGLQAFEREVWLDED